MIHRSYRFSVTTPDGDLVVFHDYGLRAGPLTFARPTVTGLVPATSCSRTSANHAYAEATVACGEDGVCHLEMVVTRRPRIGMGAEKAMLRQMNDALHAFRDGLAIAEGTCSGLKRRNRLVRQDGTICWASRQRQALSRSASGRIYQPPDAPGQGFQRERLSQHVHAGVEVPWLRTA